MKSQYTKEKILECWKHSRDCGHGIMIEAHEVFENIKEAFLHSTIYTFQKTDSIFDFLVDSTIEDEFCRIHDC